MLTKKAIIPFLALLVAATARAEGTPALDFLEADPGFADLGALQEPLDRPRLEQAALLASGVSAEDLGPYLSRLDRIVDGIDAEADQASATTAANAATVAKAEAVLTLLHKSVLLAYREDATTLDGILDAGFYNCVSSAVLYMIAVSALGIEARGVRTSDHAFCTVAADGRDIDVETTNPYGFDPGGKKDFKDSFGRVTGFAYVAPGGYGDRKPISGRELVGLILSNRVAMLERAGRFAEGARLGADYAALCPGPDSRAFLVDRVNNLVTDFQNRRDFADAESAARAAFASMPGEAKLAALVKTASYNMAVALAQSGDWSGAFEAAVAAASASPGDAATASLVSTTLSSLAQDYALKGDFAGARTAIDERADRAGPAAAASARALVGDRELVDAANGLPFAQAVAAADRILAAGEATPGRYAQAVTAIYGNAAEKMGAGGDWLGAAALADKGAAKLAESKVPDDGSLARLAATLRRNFVADAHNKFARAYNSRDYAAAKAGLTAALAAMPNDPTLEIDLAAADAALAK